jgi:hypothetical protein
VAHLVEALRYKPEKKEKRKRKKAVRFVRQFFKIMKSDGLLSSSQKPNNRLYP